MLKRLLGDLPNTTRAKAIAAFTLALSLTFALSSAVRSDNPPVDYAIAFEGGWTRASGVKMTSYVPPAGYCDAGWIQDYCSKSQPADYSGFKCITLTLGHHFYGRYGIAWYQPTADELLHGQVPSFVCANPVAPDMNSGLSRHTILIDRNTGKQIIRPGID